jgi:hypothetical protein
MARRLNVERTREDLTTSARNYAFTGGGGLPGSLTGGSPGGGSSLGGCFSGGSFRGTGGLGSDSGVSFRSKRIKPPLDQGIGNNRLLTGP